MTRSGPELRRRFSKGTNVNPFTPRELSSRAKRKAGASIDSRYVCACVWWCVLYVGEISVSALCNQFKMALKSCFSCEEVIVYVQRRE